LVTGHPIEYAQKVPGADLSDLIRGEASLQHRIDNDIVRTGRLILPYMIGAFPDARMLLTGAGATRASVAIERTTWAGRSGRGTDGARAGLGKLGIRANAHMIDPDDIDECPDISRIVQRERSHYATKVSLTGVADVITTSASQRTE